MSPHYAPRSGGDDGIRTHDPLLAGQVLSQLSYTPMVYVPSSLFIELEAPSKLNNNLSDPYQRIRVSIRCSSP